MRHLLACGLLSVSVEASADSRPRRYTDGPTATDASGTQSSASDLSLRAPAYEVDRDRHMLDVSQAVARDPGGAFVGPLFLDGSYAKHLRKLPARLRRGMAAPVGPSPVVVETAARTIGAGLGLYIRM